MTAHDVQAEILEPMQRLYLPPRNMDEAQQSAALREYLSALAQFDGTELNTAWCAVRDVHTTRAWPVPAAFVSAARLARKNLQQPASASRPNSENQRWETWKAVSRSPLAYEAVKRGVSWALKCAILHDGKKPGEVSLNELVSGKHSALKTADLIRRGQPVHHKGRMLTFNERDAATALSMFEGCLQRETEIKNEIARVTHE